MMFDTILIANRGEIACRVMRTAQARGIRCIAIFSDADAGAAHVAQADEAVRVGPAPARESYLNIAAIIAAARSSGAQAVHPGYGFLSENAAFAEACTQAGLVFIGPPAAAIRAMGDKIAAKALMEQAGVPVVQGFHGHDQDAAVLQVAAARIGYPVLIKAAAGGGGKGMRIVTAPADFADALAGAQREAQSSFGDARVLIEKYLDRPRHVEVQVFADTHGNAVYLFERDCSVQRRHQKVIEEAPAPGLSPEARRQLGEVAVRAARAVGYVGAGTVEFIMDARGQFFFMEMNTRLQVEHPVTEMITGQDLVGWQLDVAAGGKLPLTQQELTATGHAFEVRLYAEDPQKDFLPATGQLAHLRFPPSNAHVRVDTGIREGDTVTPYYDPMIAKLIVWDGDRPAALRRLRAALAECQIVGVVTNVAFLAALAAHPAFAAEEIDTGFIARHRAALVPAPRPAGGRMLALAALGVLRHRERSAAAAAAASAEPNSPWHRVDGWALNREAQCRLRFWDETATVDIVVRNRGDGFALDLPAGPVHVRGTLDGARLDADLDGARVAATVVQRGLELTVFADGDSRRLVLVDPLAGTAASAAADGRLSAPMPGRIVAVKVAAGQAVTRGTPLVVLEAMKMEHTIAAPADGTVERVLCAAGDQVAEGTRLVELQND